MKWRGRRESKNVELDISYLLKEERDRARENGDKGGDWYSKGKTKDLTKEIETYDPTRESRPEGKISIPRPSSRPTKFLEHKIKNNLKKGK